MSAKRVRRNTALKYRGLGHRSGTAVVEFALCLPLILAMVFGVVQTSNAIYLQQALTAAAYEAGNIVCVTGGTSTTAMSNANAVLTAMRVASPTVTIAPTVTNNTTTGTEITITCSAPLSSNSLIFGFLGDRTLQAKLVTQRL